MPTQLIEHKPFSCERLEGKDWEKILKIGTDKIEGLRWQLGFGTLLGAVREPDHFIHHEIDLDVDIILDDINPETLQKIKDFHNRLLNDGFELIRTQELDYKEHLYMSAAFTHKETNIIYDICYFYGIWGEDYLHIGTAGIVIRPKYTLDSKKIKINDNYYNIPKRAEDYLVGRYGEDWRIPKAKKGNWNEDCGKYFIPLT